MKQRFDVIFLGEAWDFLYALDEKSRDKIIYNIDKAKYVNDPEIFKKLEELICVRDALGDRTLFYANEGNRCVVASEPRAVIEGINRIVK